MFVWIAYLAVEGKLIMSCIKMPLKSGIALVMMFQLESGASAEPITIDLAPALFGHLDQHRTDCPKLSCGPTAAVNSFVFLQSMFPGVYIHKLVRDNNQGEIDAANDLVKRMKTCDDNVCKGTTWENFYLGKRAYIENYAPHTSDYSAESAFEWLPADAGKKIKPPDVKDKTNPTPEYLLAELMKHRDIELLIKTEGATDASSRLGHYVTLTGITWDYATMMGSMRYVDPSDGTENARDLMITDGFLSFNSFSDGSIREIKTAVSEGVPEPGTLPTIAAGLGLLLALRVRAYQLKSASSIV